MTSTMTFFRIWAHRSSGSIFGAASSPVIRNGAFLCFETEDRARAECDRLNAHRGDLNVHYTVMPTHMEATLPSEPAKRNVADAPAFSALATAPCIASDRKAPVPRIA